jgi:hypothetical protein
VGRWLQTDPPVENNQLYKDRGLYKDLRLRTPGVYLIPCEYGKVYIGQTGRSLDTRLKEHQRHICLEYPDTSAVAEHSVDFVHRIPFHNTSILATKAQFMDSIVREAIKIDIHRNNMNREMGFCLSKSWEPLICSLKKTWRQIYKATQVNACSAV